MTNYSPEVMEVHNEFMTAGDNLLKKAEEILKTEVKINPAKIARLAQFGFKSSKDATVKEDDKKEKTHQRNLVDAINYYRVKFPNYKFIPSETVKSICEKYGLVSGEAHQYKGFVPEKNLTEIEMFFEVHPDMRYSYFKPTNDRGLFASIWTSDIQIEKEEYDEIMASIHEPKKHIQSFAKGLDMEISERAVQWYQPNRSTLGIDPYDDNYGFQMQSSSQVGRTSLMDAYMQIYLQYPTFSLFGSNSGDKEKTATKKETTLRICAPISEMNTSGYELKDGYKLVYDPIVSIEVTHKNGIKGEIILTAWGDEASDELVINQNNN